MKNSLTNITKKFLLGESLSNQPKSYFQSLSDLIEQLRPASKRDSYRLTLAKEHLSKLRSHFRKLEEKVTNLEEELRVLQENNKGK